jgi:phospho-N-acetylmuramoyl-pentapeptide-transferase
MLTYLTSSLILRSGAAAIVSLALSLGIGKICLEKFRKAGLVDYVRAYSPSAHQDKKGIPTSGGIFILVSFSIGLFLFANPTHELLLISLLLTFCLGLVGFWDDRIKSLRRSSRGLRVLSKLGIQSLLAGIAALYVTRILGFRPQVSIPFTDHALKLGWTYIPLVMAVIVGTVNSVNLSDGLDGLAAGCIIWAGLAYALLAYFVGSMSFSYSLKLTFIPAARELVIFWASLLGAVSGFLWYNRHPARVFLGDTGALALGGALAITAVLVREEILLILIGGVFVVEALSVFLQVLSFQTTGKRILKMSPLHHHYELKGMKESSIVTRFWILGLFLAGAGLFSVFW